MVVSLDREALETAPIQMSGADRPVCDPPAHRVRLRQPTEESRHLVVSLRPDDEMPMIGQDAKREDADRVASVSLDHDTLERVEVGFLAE